MPVSIKGTGGGGVTLDAGAAASDTTLTLPNTTGTVALTASPTFSGTVTAAALSVSGTTTLTGTATATTITSPTATALTVQSAGTTAMTVDTSQNVGIGTTSPSSKLNVVGTIRISGNNQFQIYNAAGSSGVSIQTDNGSIAAMTFNTSGVEAMRIDTSGNLLVATTSQIGSDPARLNLLLNSSLENAIVARSTATSAGKYWRIGYINSSNTWHLLNQSGTGVYITDGATSWTGTSDERMKTDLKPIEDATNKVATLRAVTGRFKTDQEGISRSFLIAQDVQKVLPEAVSVQSDEQGTLGLAYTDVIPLLVAAIKELSAKNDALEARLAALEAK